MKKNPTNKNNPHLEVSEIANQITTRVDFSLNPPPPNNKHRIVESNTWRMPQIKAYQITTRYRWVFVPQRIQQTDKQQTIIRIPIVGVYFYPL